MHTQALSQQMQRLPPPHLGVGPQGGDGEVDFKNTAVLILHFHRKGELGRVAHWRNFTKMSLRAHPEPAKAQSSPIALSLPQLSAHRKGRKHREAWAGCTTEEHADLNSFPLPFSAVSVSTLCTLLCFIAPPPPSLCLKLSVGEEPHTTQCWLGKSSRPLNYAFCMVLRAGASGHRPLELQAKDTESASLHT